MNNRSIDWLSEWKNRYPKEIYSWDAQYPDIDREYVTFYPCDVRYLNPTEILTEPTEEREIYLYIHVPFCKYLCPFCFFNKYPFDVNKIKTYLTALKKEIHYYSRKPYLQNCRVISVYFGGGTPTVLSPKQILEVLQFIKDCFNVAEHAEITVESTPLTINEDMVKELTIGGVNRISIGVQSFNDKLLQRLYLPHKGEQCIRIIKVIKDFGINVGIDLMYRLPNQTLSDWERDLSVAINLNVDTISCYSLELPPPVKRKKFSNVLLPSLEEDIRMYYFVIDYLGDNDYRQYTIADFSMPQKESSYVMNCWEAPQHEYLAFGAGAHSFIGGYVFYNIASLKYYFEWIEKGQPPILFGKKLTKEEDMARYFVLGVKCLSVDIQKCEQIFGVGAVKRYGKIFDGLENKGLIKVSQTQLQLTRKGLVYVDNISKSFYTPNNKGKLQPVGILLQNMKPTDFIPKGDNGVNRS
jgi:oxygen-independent coproporphyrinogen-3 oxidase